MNYRDYFKNILMASSDPKLQAEALKDYFKSIYERNLANADIMVADEADLTDVDLRSAVSITNMQGDTTFISLETLRNSFQQLAAIDDSDDIDFDDQFLEVTGLDGTIIRLTLDDIETTLSNAVTDSYLTFTAFDSISSVGENMDANRFLNIVNTRFNGNVTPEVTDTVLGIYESVSSAVDLPGKIDAIASFTGFSTFLQDPANNYELANVDITGYTGRSPASSWVSGLDFSSVGSTFSSLGELYLKSAQFMLVTGPVMVAKFIGSTFSKIFTGLKRTFVDPEDYEITSGSDVNLFNIPARELIPVLGRNSLRNKIINGSSQDGQVCFSFGPVYYRASTSKNAEPNASDSNIYIERYVRPSDGTKLLELVNSYGVTSDNVSSFISSLTFGSFASIISELQTGDFSISKGASEETVYAGIGLSYYISNVLMIIQQSFMSLTESASIYNTEINVNSLITSAPSNVVWYLSNMTHALTDLFRTILGYNETTGLNVLSNPGTMCFGHNFILGGSTLTNKRFIEALTSVPIYKWGEDASFDGTLTTSVNAFTVDQSPYTVKNGYTQVCPDRYETQLYDNRLPAGVNCVIMMQWKDDLPSGWSAPYFGYSRKFDINSLVNARVKTDSENASAISKLLLGIAIAVVTIVVVAKAPKVIKAARKKREMAFNELQAALKKFQKTCNLKNPKAIDTAWDNVYKAQRKYKRYARLLGPAMGAAAGITPATMSKSDSSGAIISLINKNAL